MFIIHCLVKISSFSCLYIVPVKISLRWLVFSRDNVEDMITISSSRLFLFIGKIRFMIMPVCVCVCVCMCACMISHVWLFVNPWTVCGPPGSSVHGIFQARILKWITVSYSRGSSWPRDWTDVLCLRFGRWSLTLCCLGNPTLLIMA